MDRENHRHAVLGSAVVANFGQFGARVAISPFVLAIAAEFGRSKGEIGVVLTLMWAVYACLQFPSGAGLYFAAGTALLDKRFENTGQAFSFHSAGAPLAGLVVPVGASLVAASYSWRAGILAGVAAAAGALAFAGAAVGSTPPPSPGIGWSPERSSSSSRARRLRS